VSDRAPEALPADVAALVELERRSVAATDGARARVAARLGLEGAASAPPAAVGAGGWGGFVAPLTILTIAAVAGAVWLAARSPGEVARTPERPPSQVKPPVIAPAAPPAPSPVEARVTEPVAARSTIVPDSEVSLLAAARKALAAGNPRAALALVRRHERRWPDGELVQEREVLAIQALAASGAAPEARARADRFLQRFPGSTLSEAVRQVRADSARVAPGP
jgi:hypothetical protein